MLSLPSIAASLVDDNDNDNDDDGEKEDLLEYMAP